MPSRLGYRLVEDATPMELCRLCLTLNTSVFLESFLAAKFEGTIEHQPCFTALEVSALAGCDMCSMFLEDAIQQVLEHRKCSSSEARQALRDEESEKHSHGPCLLNLYFTENPMEDQCSILEYITFRIPFCYYEGQPSSIIASYVLRNCRGSDDGTLAQSELSSLPDWDIARSWLRECKVNHERCSPVHSTDCCGQTEIKIPQLPTRVIDVGLSDQDEPRLIESRNYTADYVTLSHCWGNAQQLKTVSSNIKAHLTGIPLLSMPMTFQHAVITTRELGFRYLWIDSLCIVQDSPEDWQRECSRMANTYRSSTLTICGSKASSSSSGFLHPRAYTHTPPRLWEFATSEGTGYQSVTIDSFNSRQTDAKSNYPRSQALVDEEAESPLQHRGWILQEYLLSPRILWFGLYRMYWECSMAVQFEDFRVSRTQVSRSPKQRDYGLHCSFSKSAVSPFETLDPTDMHKTWLLVIQDYTNRSLSMPNDKLPAVSAIASWLFGGNGDNYLAGLPKTTLHEGLAWRIWAASGQQHRVPAYRAPSWSWASTDYPVNFPTLRGTRPIRSNTNYEARRRRYALMSEQNKMDIHSTHVKLEGSDPFGGVISGSIKLRGRTKVGHVVSDPYNTTFLWVADPTSGNKTATFFPDDSLWNSYTNPTKFPQHGVTGAATKAEDPPTVCPGGDQGSFKGQSTASSSLLSKKIKCVCIDYYWNCDWIALAIEELISTHDEGPASPGTYKAYRRIGLVDYYSIIHADFEWFKDSEWESIELF